MTDWMHNGREHPYDYCDFDLDLGCGRAKKGRIGLDRFDDHGVDVVHDLDSGLPLPFDDQEFDNVISHHALEHIGLGFINVMDECWRVMKPGGLLRIIVPVFPSWDAVADPDHKRVFVSGSFDFFCDGTLDVPLDAYSVPYTSCKFTKESESVSPPTPLSQQFTPADRREMRVALRKPR